MKAILQNTLFMRGIVITLFAAIMAVGGFAQQIRYKLVDIFLRWAARPLTAMLIAANVLSLLTMLEWL